MLSPSCSLGSEGEEVESPGCFWEKSSLMWGACLLQVGFVPSLLSLLFFCLFLAPEHTGVAEPPALPNLCPGSVSSSWLCWKTTHFPSSFSFREQEEPPCEGQMDKPVDQSSSSNESSRGGLMLGFPVMPSGALAAP